MKMTQEEAEEITDFSQKDFEEWIWQRTHGIDRMTSITTICDPNPHHVLLGGYEILTDKNKSKFCIGLLNSLRHALQVCTNLFRSGEQKDLKRELLAIERHLNVLYRIPPENAPEGANDLVVKCYKLIFGQETSDVLQRLVLSFGGRYSNVASYADLMEALKDGALASLAFRILLRRQGVEAVSRYFAQYVKAERKKPLMKVMVRDMKRQFEDRRVLEEQMGIALQELPAELQEVIESEMVTRLGDYAHNSKYGYFLREVVFF